MTLTRIAPPLAVVLAGAALSGPASAAPATTTGDWLLTGTARGGSALVIEPAYDGCGPQPTVAAVETSGTISISVTTPVPTPGVPIACAQVQGGVAPVTVRLASPVGGRRIVGPGREASTPFAAYQPTTDPFRAPAPVPEVRGLRRLDAHRVLCAWGFATRTPGSRPGATSPIVGQTPSAGSRATPLTAAQLRRRTSVPDCTGEAWRGAPRVVLLHGPR